MSHIRIFKAVCAGTILLFTVRQTFARTVEVAVKPDAPWTNLPTRLLEDLPELPVDGNLTKYGGLAAHKLRATGFFHTAKVKGRWWLVDPEGGLFIHKGVASVKTIPTAGAEEALKSAFGSESAWAEKTAGMLDGSGFNGFGAWTDIEQIQKAGRPFVYTQVFNFMAGYGKIRGGTYQQPGHLGYPNDCIFVFDPGFETFCDEYAGRLAQYKNDPWLLGYFSDNELPFKPALLTNYLALPAEDPGYQAAREFLQSRHGRQATPADITARDDVDFLTMAAERYFRIVSRAIKKYDPNHLYLGPRLHGLKLLCCPEFFKAIGPYLDVVSVNYYRVWTPDSQIAMWSRQAGKPVLITDWYAKGLDSGLANTGGAGWLVKTQKGRGEFYQNFALGLLETKACVGWHWFKYADNDPADRTSDPSNRDSNKGIVNNRYQPYTPLLDAMKLLNQRVYSIAGYFDNNTGNQIRPRKTGENIN